MWKPNQNAITPLEISIDSLFFNLKRKLFSHKNLTSRGGQSLTGFTLIELLVVISIIGLLSSVVLVAVASAREKSRIAVAEEDIRVLETAVHVYHLDTGRYPPTCNRTCTETSDPFLHSQGIAGWAGPYTSLWDQRTPWKGHLNFYNDIHGPIISFDDDSPGASGSDNVGPLPASSILKIDQDLDNGDPNTGIIRTSLSPECDAAGEFCYFVPQF